MSDSVAVQKKFLQNKRRRAHWGLLGVLVGTALGAYLITLLPRAAAGPAGFGLSLIVVSALVYCGGTALKAAVELLALERNQNEPE